MLESLLSIPHWFLITWAICGLTSAVIVVYFLWKKTKEITALDIFCFFLVILCGIIALVVLIAVGVSIAFEKLNDIVLIKN